ncbi:hypothetical protein J1N35_006186 [Gossypium stocksii]|uniref:Uncharacterized protein n=1 Tax=Gossypium stocksii TaxID=47602 RepID=A0A9D3WF88_9ROSI|nr:hypothetical protein J1N35_006186 [Gossypium stocksii]
MASLDTELAYGSPKAFLKKPLFFIIKAFVVGVILSIGFIHVLSYANENLTSRCLSEIPWDKFPLAKPLAMCSPFLPAIDFPSIENQIKKGKGFRSWLSGLKKTVQGLLEKDIQYTSNQEMAETGVRSYTEESDQAYKSFAKV